MLKRDGCTEELDEIVKRRPHIINSLRSSLNYTLLMISFKYQKMFEYLIKKPQDLSVTTRGGYNILHIFIKTNVGDKLEYLDSHRITNEIMNKQSENFLDTPLHLAVVENDQTAIKWLLVKGADSSIKNSLGKTPYDLCYDENTKKLFSNQEVK